MSTQSSRPPDPAEGDGDAASLRQVLRNLGDEITVALGICVNIEEIIADQLFSGGGGSNFVRRELQNVDRLIQTLTDMKSLASNLAEAADDQTIARDALREGLIMEEMARRLLSQEPTRRQGSSAPASDVTFF